MKDQQDFYDNMSDFEIRVIGATSGHIAPSVDRTPEAQTETEKNEAPPKKTWFRWWYVLIAAIAVLAGCLLCMMMGRSEPAAEESVPDAPESYETVALDSTVVETGSQAYCEVKVDSVNDINLRIVTPVGCLPELHLGNVPESGGGYMMVVQAADVRGDNGEISGAYVCQGELKAKGRAKLGFCAIIGNEITLGRQTETPLFERAIEENGYFFRQYSLVNEGKMIDIKPKGKALRRALCYYEGKIVIIESMERESYHDFSQALADLGVEEALALVGGDALFSYVDENGEIQTEGACDDKRYKNVNFIVWK